MVFSDSMDKNDAATRWLLLVYQFSKGPDSRRVKVWRRLQNIGSVAIKNSVYVLPENDQSREDFEWLLTELRSAGADGVILDAQVVDGMNDQQIRDLFRTARGQDYRELREEITSALDSLTAEALLDEEAVQKNARNTLKRARNRIAEIEAIDFFGAEGHGEAENAMRILIERIADCSDNGRTEKNTMESEPLEQLKGRIWVTRRGVKVDRVASAWLIQRWIDPAAEFKFVAGKGYSPAVREIRFDMFDAEFTHEGDLCTFEVLAQMARSGDDALRRVGEVVHDIDLKDCKFDRIETPGIANLLAGIFAGIDDDHVRIERTRVVFDNLYRFFETAKT